MKTYLLVIFCLLFFVCYSQSGVINFKVEKLENEDKIKKDTPKGLVKIIRDREKQLKYVNVQLSFNEKNSIFKTKETMGNDATFSLESILRVTSTSEQYYVDLPARKSYKISKFRGDFLSLSNEMPEWEITNSSKIILGYRCVKATTSVTNFNKSKRKIIAWFAKDLPFNFGPKTYFGLPGLILEIEDFGYRFYATTIDVSEKSKKIKNPVKGRVVSEVEFNEEQRRIGNPYKN